MVTTTKSEPLPPPDGSMAEKITSGVPAANSRGGRAMSLSISSWATMKCCELVSCPRVSRSRISGCDAMLHIHTHTPCA